MKYPASEHLARKYVSQRGMKNILIIGSTGQIGTELAMTLRRLYPVVVAGYIPAAPPKGELLETGPCEVVDITNPQQITEVVRRYKIDTIFNLAALLSAVAEAKPHYYQMRFGVDTRSVRFPGLISNVAPPGGGTTDYAVDIYYAAVREGRFACPLRPGTYMDMMYMPDALRACVELMEADPTRLIHRNSFNITSMSFDPEGIAASIREVIPTFEMTYELDELRQGIADSWPNSLDDSCARSEWDWKPQYDLPAMTRDMIETIRRKG